MKYNMDGNENDEDYSSYNHTHNKSTGGSGSSGGCFVATTVYGDSQAPQVRLLRQFRDRKLLMSATGRMFIKMYYGGIGQWIGSLLNNQARFLKPLVKKILDAITSRIPL